MTSKAPEDAAADWFVRLHSGDVSEATRLEHKAWLAEDDRNRERFEAVENSMRDLAPIDDWMRTEVNRLNARVMARRARRTKGLIGVASAAAAVAAVTVWITTNPAGFYTTERAEQREISLDDGSRIHLNSASSVAVRYSPEARTVELKSGEGVFDVSRDAQRPFVVAARDAEVVAIGTQFRVWLNGGDVTVTVLEGAVAVFNRPASGPMPAPGSIRSDSEPTLLYANDQITLSNGVMTAVESVNASLATAWREGKLIYDATPLRQVVAEMSRYTPIELAVADGVPDHPITGLIQIRSPDAMLRFISNAVPVTPVRASKERIVLHAAPPVPE
ncbi:MAG: FecR domain-containing protein [Gammaproteobacteria bacterium]|nr:FecR domain-containing protein [Gammaproteobacteria bacterium]MDE0443145.1 FecR domain-containing protein [Gammaproteobacteria bacterium]